MARRPRVGAADREAFAAAQPVGAHWIHRLGAATKRQARTRALDAAARRAAGLSRAETERALRFARYARLFPADVASILAERTRVPADELPGMAAETFESVLSEGGLAPSEVARHSERLEAIRLHARGGAMPEGLNGLDLDLAPRALSTADANSLRSAGIDTLDEWVLERGTAGVSDLGRATLDAYAGLRAAGVPTEAVASLIGVEVDSAYRLALLPADRAAEIARRSGLSLEELERWSRSARLSLSQAGATIANTIAYTHAGLSGIGVGAPTDRPCGCCPDDWSIFSRFAYLNDLIRLSGDSVATLDQRLKQNFAALTLANAYEPVLQIRLCLDVLSRAIPQPFTHAQRLPAQWQLIRGGMGVIGLRPEQLAEVVAGFAPAIDAADLAGRLATHLPLPGSPPPATFGPQEIDSINLVMDGLGTQHFAATVANEPAFRGRPNAEIFAEATRRARDALAPDFEAANVLRRDAYKLRSGLNDHTLEQQYCIEMSAGACETTTRVAQAIHSMQRLIDQRRAAAATAQDRSRWSYDSYETWRAKRLAETFPEFAAIARDDVVTGEYGPATRGSILRTGAAARAQLKDAVDEVRTALGTARVGPGTDYAGAQPFSGTEFALYFEQGLRTIESLLDADESHARATEHLDNDQPGLALAALDDMRSQLDAVGRLVFREGGVWRDPGRSSFEALLALPPPARKDRQIEIGNEIFYEPKALFEANPALTPITGLDTASGRFTDLARWRVGPGTRLATPADGPARSAKLIKSSTGYLDRTVCETTYRDGQSLGDYTVSCRVQLESAEGFHGEEGEIVGVVARVDGNARYRLVITTEWVTETYIPPSTDIETGNDAVDAVANFLIGLIPSDDEISHIRTLRAFLVLQRVNAGGQTTELARSAGDVFFGGGTYEFSLAVSGRSLTGEVVSPSNRRHAVSVASASQPPGSQGSFGIVASGSVDAVFGPLKIEVVRQGDDLFPPFFTTRRGASATRHIVDSGGRYADHIFERAPLSLSFDPERLFRVADGIDGQRLAQVRRNGQFLNLLFDDGQTVVDTAELDALLDGLMSLAFYLAYAALPLRMSDAYAKTGDYARAAALLRLLYDDEVAGESARSVCPFFDQPPPAAGATVGFDVRLFRLRLADIYIAWGEWLFRKNHAESRHAARLLFERVLALHGDPDHCDCNASYGEVAERLTRAVSLGVANSTVDIETLAAIEALVSRVLAQLARARSACVSGETISVIFGAFDANPPGSAGEALDLLRQCETELAAAAAPPALNLAMADGPVFTSRVIDILNVGAGLTVHKVSGFGGLGLQGAAANWIVSQWAGGLCVPENPLIARQKRRACILLDHLENCRNILGYAEDFVPERRFAFLLQNARQFAELALAAEKDLLSHRQMFEQESFSLLQAVNQLAAVSATSNIERMKAENALGEVAVAELQLGQAQFTVQHYDTLIANGLSLWERVALGSAWTSAGLSSLAVLPAVAGIALAAVGVGTAATGIGAVPGAAMATVGAAGSLMSAVTGGFSGAASAAGGISNAASMTASYERREEEWRHQLGVGYYAAAIAQASVRQAIGRHMIALAEHDLAELHRRSAADVVQFLSAKFMNREMWAWMQRTMREQYRLRLSYAINAAFVAERALAFELQRNIDIVRFDYFDPRRDGLLGATQLTTDIAALESTRQQLEGRKLQMSKHVSLASKMPADFQMFREGAGRLPFRTLLRWFDEDFPGHYLRLIRGVRLTVIALVPPLDGIHATLTNTGVSRVMTGPPFGEVTIRANVERAAYSGAYQASGVFELHYQGEYRLPFEGGGVEADWVFELPRAANAFDFRTIADVILTIDYTAMSDDALRRRKQLELGSARSGERALSFKFNYPDIWYQLHHPEAYDAPMTVEFDVRAGYFPANVADPLNDQIMLYLLRRDGTAFEVPNIVLEFVYPDGAGGVHTIVANAADTAGGVVATRRPDANGVHPWNVFRNRPAIGRWRIRWPDTPEMRARWTQEDIVDVAFVVSYSGNVPGWPT